MRLVESITLLATLVGTFVTIVAAVEQRLINRIQNNSFDTEKKPKELPKLRSISKWRLDQLQKLKIIVKTRNGEYHFEEVKYNKLRKQRVLTVVIFLILSISLIIFLY